MNDMWFARALPTRKDLLPPAVCLVSYWEIVLSIVYSREDEFDRIVYCQKLRFEVCE
jgi:hypothetical protein